MTSAPDARPPAAGPIVIPDAATQPAAYVAALLRTLGDWDPV